MDLASFAEYFNLTPESRSFVEKYKFNIIADTLEEIPETLQDDFILRALSDLRRPPAAEPLLAAADVIRKNPFLLAFYNYFCYYWWQQDEPMIYGHVLPEVSWNSDCSDVDGVIYLLIALAGFDAVRNAYAKFGLPPEIAEDTIQYVCGAVEEYAAGHDGKTGVSSGKVRWMRLYVSGKLFRIGRLEYMIQDPREYLPAVYKRKADDKCIALCRDGWLLRKDGLLLFADEPGSTAYVTAALEQTAESITGIPVNPAGFAEVDRRVTLKLDEYVPLWNAWDLTPGIHIPGGGGMKRAAVEDSLRRARDFFPRYFKRNVAAFICASWIFNPDFEAELPNSNLADFMREVYLFPFRSVGVEGLQFVFGKSQQDWSEFPADNSLRLTFHRLRESGKRLKCGGMFIDSKAVDSFGTQKYRNDYAAFDEL